MFSLVTVREAFPHLHGVDQLSCIFRRSGDTFADRVSPSGSVPHTIWAIPGHILVSVMDGTRLLVFDFLGKPNPFPEFVDLIEICKRASGCETDSAVLNLFFLERNSAYLFIFLKDGTVFVMNFASSNLQWMFVTTLNLCKSKKTQIISICYSSATKEIFWCEKRSPTQCCVCKTLLGSSLGKLTLEKTEAILHNCPPMHLLEVGELAICLKPVANNPPNILVMWLHELQQLQFFSFNTFHEDMIIKPSTSDYPNAMLETISLWISSPSGIYITSVGTHLETKELIVLDTKMNLHLLAVGRSGSLSRRLLCVFDCKETEDTFRPTDLFAVRCFAGVLLHSGEIQLFEIQSGRRVWASELLKSSGPRRLRSRSNIPLLAFWNLSGLWILKPESAVSQAEVMVKSLSDRASIDHVHAQSVGTQKISRGYSAQSSEVSRKMELKLHRENRGARNEFASNEDQERLDNEAFLLYGRKTCTSGINVGFSAALQYLLQWNSPNVVSEFFIKLLYYYDQMNLSLDVCAITVHHFPDPILALALFGDNESCSWQLEARLRQEFYNKQRNGAEEKGRNLGQMRYCEDYLRLCEQQREILGVPTPNPDTALQGKQTPKSVSMRTLLPLMINVGPSECHSRYLYLYDLFPQQFLKAALCLAGMIDIETMNQEGDKSLTFHGNEALGKTAIEEMSKTFWNRTLHKDTEVFEFLCCGLWKDSLDYLVPFVRKAMESSGDMNKMDASSCRKKDDFVHRCLLSLPRTSSALSTKETLVLAELHRFYSDDPGETVDFFLSNECYKQAIDVLCTSSKLSEAYNSMFYKILTVLVKTKRISEYLVFLQGRIPDSFTAVDFCQLLLSSGLDGTKSTVFPASNKELSLEHVLQLFDEILKPDRVDGCS